MNNIEKENKIQQTNNKYIIKVIAPWMIDELIVFSKNTKVDVILLKRQEEFYNEGLERLNINNLKVYTEPFSYKNFSKKIFIVISFFFQNFFKFRPDYNFVIAFSAIFWFLKIDLSHFSKNSNIHAQFATQSTIISLLIKRYYNNKPKYSFTFHAYDIYFKSKWFKLLVENCHQAFSISKYNINYINKKYLDSEKIVLARLGVFTKDIKPVNKIQNEVLTLGLVSWFVEKKGIKYLLKALKILQEKGYNNVELILAGDGPLKDDYLTYINDNNIENMVNYIGSVDGNTKVNFYNSLDAFILPSISLKDDQDGIPVVLMEAIAYGLPIISTDVSGIPEICMDKFNGFLLEEKNTNVIVKSIISLMENREQLAAFSKNSLQLSKEYDIEINSIVKMKAMNWI